VVGKLAEKHFSKASVEKKGVPRPTISSGGAALLCGKFVSLHYSHIFLVRNALKTSHLSSSMSLKVDFHFYYWTPPLIYYPKNHNCRFQQSSLLPNARSVALLVTADEVSLSLTPPYLQPSCVVWQVLVTKYRLDCRFPDASVNCVN
jgi:hypothetical protein